MWLDGPGTFRKLSWKASRSGRDLRTQPPWKTRFVSVSISLQTGSTETKERADSFKSWGKCSADHRNPKFWTSVRSPENPHASPEQGFLLNSVRMKYTPRAYREQKVSRSCVAAWVGGESRGRWIHANVLAESLHGSPETMTILLICYTAIQNKKLKKRMKCRYRNGLSNRTEVNGTQQLGIEFSFFRAWQI